jgi:dihydrodipicolinate synthase/N-acetylneuraminate lyase
VAWNNDDSFDESCYCADVRRCCQAGIPGIYTCGSTGEFYALEWEEFQAVSDATVETCHECGTPAMIGCTATSTRGAMRRAAYAKEIEADAIQVALPFWDELQDVEIIPFFRAVAEAAPELPFSIYETTRTKKVLSLEQHRRIKDAIPLYMMVKANDGTIGNTAAGCRELSAFINVFVGENRWCELGPVGTVGCCSSMVYWNPELLLSLWQLQRQGDWQALRAKSARIDALHGFLQATYGPRGFSDSAYDRMGARATGFLKTSLRCRGPYGSPTTDDVNTLRSWMVSNYPEMLAPSRPGNLTKEANQF